VNQVDKEQTEQEFLTPVLDVPPTFGAMFAMAMRPDRIDLLKARAANSVLPPKNPERPQLRLVGPGVVQINIKGALTQEDDFWSWYCGDTSYASIMDSLREANARDDVTDVLLYCNTPGGEAAGCPDVAALVRAVAKKKTIIAYGSGDVCSAGIWIASAATKLVVSPNCEAGSIGVVITHLDTSKYENAVGFKVTEITSPKDGGFKRAASQHLPLDQAGRDYLQAISDKHFGLFRQDISAQRSLVGAALDAVANGKVFIGQEVVDLGLADKVDSYDNVLTGLIQKKNKVTVIMGGISMEKQEFSDAAALAAAYPELCGQLTQTAVVAERERITKIQKITPKGLESLAQTCISEGVTYGDTAVKFIEAANAKNITILANIQEEAPPVIAVTPPSDVSPDEEQLEAAFMVAIKDHNARHNSFAPTAD
jgi:signal peptide peptidase SppA